MKIVNKSIYLLLTAVLIVLFALFLKQILENRSLKQVLERFKADSRIAEVLVTAVKKEANGRQSTTIKFLEYDVEGNPLQPKYFTFSGDLIQFQSLVIRFDDFHVAKGDILKGKSAYLFLKAFALMGKQTQEFEITKVNSIPDGYNAPGLCDNFEEKLWRKFWRYALEPAEAKRMGIKNAQIEAPGTKFVPGAIYIIKIEHDGGMRIDSKPIPQILRGEKIE